jgi:uncharacterized protein YbjT (DUF2867 family)
MTSILVTGGTGTLGRPVVEHLLRAGHDVRVASRRPRPTEPVPYAWSTVDFDGGESLDAAVAGADAIVHCARSFVSAPRVSWNQPPRGLRPRMDHLLIEAARRAGTAHLVYISIVGIDDIPFSYYRAKRDGERALVASGVPWTILRTTQFHDLVLTGLSALARLPVMPVPAGVRFQPIDVREVAGRLAGLAAGPPAGRVPDMGGPQVRTAQDLAGAYLRAGGLRRRVVPVRAPGATFAGFARGDHLAPDRAVGTVGFDEFLAQHVSGAPARRVS